MERLKMMKEKLMNCVESQLGDLSNVVYRLIHC